MDKKDKLNLKVAETAVDWGIELAFDHHESVFEELLENSKAMNIGWRLERAKDTISEIWEAGKEYLKIKKRQNKSRTSIRKVLSNWVMLTKTFGCYLHLSIEHGRK